MALARGIKQSQDALIPGLRAANQTASELKPAARAMSKAGQRIGHHDPVGFTQAALGLGLGAGGAAALGPLGALLSLLPILQRAGPLSRIGQGLYTGGGAAARAGAGVSQSGQAALLAQLLDEAKTEP